MLTTLEEAVGIVDDGSTVYLGGFGYNQPFAVVHELIRQEARELRVVRASGGVPLDLLIGAGCVREAVVSHCWNAIGPAPTYAFRRAVEDGVPRELDVEEFGLGELALRLFAGARGLPFVPAGAVEGTGQFQHRLHDDKYTPVEFDGETHHVLKPLAPDVGFVHVQRADEEGNAQLRGPRAELQWGALACDRLVVVAETIVDTDRIRETPGETLFGTASADAVVECPGGAHPSGVLDCYERDVPYLQYYASATETRGAFEEYVQTWIHDAESRQAYLRLLEEHGFGSGGVTGRPDEDDRHENSSEATGRSTGPSAPGADGEPSRHEQLLYLVAREFPSDGTVFTGFHWPVVAAHLARRLHAPQLRSVFEAGIITPGSERLPTSTTEVGVFDGHAEAYGNLLDTLRSTLGSATLDGAVVDAANVDRFGNVNSTTIGPYDEPQVRLPGPGGARDILARVENVTLVCGSTDARRYVDRVSYVSSPGHLDGDGTREAAGFEPKTGPKTLLTPFGRFEFDDSGRAELVGLTHGTTVDEVRDVTGWDVPNGTYPTLPIPDSETLQTIRGVFAEAADRGYRSVRP